MKERRRKVIKERKNFLPSLLITILLWACLGLVVYFTSPDTIGFVPLFFGLVFFALLFTFSLILATARRGLIVSLAITLFLILRYFGIGNFLNGFLIAGVAIACLIYFWYSD